MNIKLLSILLLLTLHLGANTLDPGKEVVGKLSGTIIYASETANQAANNLPEEQHLDTSGWEQKWGFKHYRRIGNDTQAIYRSYENWLKPIKGSDQIMLSYSVVKPTDDGYEIDLSFWQEQRKVFRTTSLILEEKKPLIILGPKWRDGQLLFAIELKD